MRRRRDDGDPPPESLDVDPIGDLEDVRRAIGLLLECPLLTTLRHSFAGWLAIVALRRSMSWERR
jgi:hypothetical protein